ncbi:hypothetical protein J5N97_025626 [Dioscorea zingiberensis]|uniref:Syntaxin N-terminal domain-containing protein n=1 Tax=Dioscorea zingiberensis TaxID=325984 RepID=A0A9D5H5Y8_9LILI|nr:hypothetical protein J5N97_025626 [Dioscorea zingiberensis]
MSVDQQSPRERSIELGTHIPVNKSNYGMGEFFKQVKEVEKLMEKLSKQLQKLQEANEESKSVTKASAMKVIKQRMEELSLIRSSVLLLALHRARLPWCLYIDGGLVVMVTILRTCADVIHLAHIWLQFRLAYVSRESLVVVGCGKLVWDARDVASHYLRSIKGFWFDLFVILPVPQVHHLRKKQTQLESMTLLPC